VPTERHREPVWTLYYTGVLARAFAVCVLTGVVALVPSAMAAQEAAGALPLFPLRVRWSVDLGNDPAAGPAADQSRVFLPLADGALVAVDALSGQVAWRVADVPTRLVPVADQGRVHVVGERVLTTLDAATGDLLWTRPLPATVSAPLVARGGWVVVPLDTADVLAVRADDGTVVWQRTYPTAVVAPGAINGDRLYLPGADSRVRAVHLIDGQPLWEQAIGGAVLAVSPLGARVYVGGKDNFFYCLDERSGRVLWRWRTGADLIGAAQADDRRVYFTSLDTLLRALDRRNGAQRWRRPLPWRPLSGPLLVGNTVVVTGLALDLRGFSAETGEPAGEFALSPDRLEVLEGVPQVFRRDTLPGDFLIVAVADGRVLAIEHAFGLAVSPLTDLPGEPMALTPPPVPPS
jgi:outer membrane protein assembly factor BamB